MEAPKSASESLDLTGAMKPNGLMRSAKLALTTAAKDRRATFRLSRKKKVNR